MLEIRGIVPHPNFSEAYINTESTVFSDAFA